MQHTRLITTLALGLFAAPLACAHGTEKLVSSGVQGGVAGGLGALSDPKNKEMLVRLLQDADIKQAAHDLVAALTGGALDGLSDDERQAKIREASDAYIRTVAAAAGQAISEDISPAVTRAVEDIAGGAVASALRPANRKLAQSMVDGVTRSTVLAFTQSTAQGLRDDLGPALTKVLDEDLGPALQRVVEQNLGPAVRKVIAEDLQPAIQAALGGEDGGGAGTFARALTKQIVLGVNDGMSELGISPSPNNKDGLGFANWLLIVLGVLLLLATLLLVRGFLSRRALARDRARSEAMLVDILRAIKSSETGAPDALPDLDAVLERVYQHMPELETENSYLATIVGKATLPTRRPAPAPKRRA
jgi:hypothetical protein